MRAPNLSWPWRLFLLALAVRLASIVLFRAQIPEFWEYEEIAGNLIHGRGFLYSHFGTLYRSYTEPPYPFLVASVYLVTGHSYLALVLVQVVISALLAPAVFAVGRRVISAPGAALAGLLVAFHPGLVRYTLKFHTLVLDSLFLTLALLFTLRARERPDAREGALWGAILGLAVLTRPTVAAFLPVAFLWVLTRLPARRAFHLSAMAVVVMATVISPWVIRGYAIHGAFVLTRTNTPFVFWLGNHPNASGSALSPSGVSLFDVAPSDLRARVFAADELGQNRIFMEEASRYIREEPLAFVGRTAQKFLYFWWFSPQAGFLYPWWQFRIYQAYYVLVLAAAAIGLAATVRHGSRARSDAFVLLLAFLFSVSFLQSFFYVEGRHRLGVEGVFLILSALGVLTLLSRAIPHNMLFCKGIDRPTPPPLLSPPKP